jgi:gamma-glutamyltranspeptidase
MVDEGGLAVAITSTVNLYFGSFVMAGGIVLNDEMDDFSSPDRSNSFGYPPSVPNFIAAGKRPLSSMTPAIAERNGQLRLVLGGSGGSRIITGVIQVHMVLALFLFLICSSQVLLQSLTAGRDVADAVGLPRLHEQLLPEGVNVEARFDSSYEGSLASLGHTVVRRGPMYADAVVQMVEAMADGTLRAACDWRKDDDPNLPCETAGA